MAMEAKATEEQDPFGKRGQCHIDTVTQIAISARNLFFTHGFCHVFMVGIYGHSARIARFDRSSAVVSKRFDYRTRPDILQRFFWRFVHPAVGDTVVGCDPNVRPLAPTDIEWVGSQLETLQWGISVPHEELRKGRMVKVPESDAADAEIRTFLLFDLIDLNARLFSRATMVWLALEDTRGRSRAQGSTDNNPSPKLVVFKETWRQIIRRSESHFYERLSEIPDDVRTGLPKMLFGADVGKRQMDAWKAAGGKFPFEVDATLDPPTHSASADEHTSAAPDPAPDIITINANTTKDPPPLVGASADQPATSASTAPPSLPYPIYQTHSWRLLFGDKHTARERSLVRFVVNAIGRPLKRFRSTRELVEAVRDAIEGDCIFSGI